jgi:iron complex outermembrane receptor protein
MYLKKYLLSIAFLFAGNLLIAQSIVTDTIALDEVSVTANRLTNFTTGSKIQKIETSVIKEFQSKPLNEILSKLTSLNVNTYGLGGLSTASLRGTGSGHTAVFWNGFNLQSPLNGGIDISKIPIDFIDDIQVQHGGSGSLFGSGAIGGVIHLNNNLDFNKGTTFSVNQNMGSFSNLYSGAKLTLSNQQSVTSIRVYRQSAKNDFKYINTQELEDFKATQINAGLTHYGAFISNSLIIKQNKTLTTNIWYQDLYNEIQPTMNVNKSTANSTDKNLRLSSVWKASNSYHHYYVRVAYIDEKYNYKNPEYNVSSRLNARSINSEIENRFIISQNHQINIGLDELYEIGETNNFEQTRYRNRASAFLSYRFFSTSDKFATVLSLRSELVNTDFTPVMPSVSARYTFLSNLSLNTNISRIYKIPTFNDLYWTGWGNPDLEPENGWTMDLGLSFEKKTKDINISSNATYFNNTISNWIIWTPSLTSWTPENITKVWSRGLESSLSADYLYSKGKIGLSALYSYTKATNQNNDSLFIKEFEKQLIYTPTHKGSASLYISYSGFFLRYTHQLVGKRFTSKDNSYFVNGYHIGDLSFGKIFLISKNEFIINLRINNLWNENYQVMVNYSMPMVNYQISLSYNFNKSN